MSKVLDITRKATWALGVNKKIYNYFITLFHLIVNLIDLVCINYFMLRKK